MDLLVLERGQRLGYEFKFSDAPALTHSMSEAKKALGLDSLSVVYPGSLRYPLADGIEAVPVKGIG